MTNAIRHMRLGVQRKKMWQSTTQGHLYQSEHWQMDVHGTISKCHDTILSRHEPHNMIITTILWEVSYIINITVIIKKVLRKIKSQNCVFVHSSTDREISFASLAPSLPPSIS